MKKFYPGLIFILALSSLHAQDDNKAALVKAAMTLKIAQNVDWPDQENLTAYRIGILTQQEELSEAFINTMDLAVIHNKPVEVVRYKKLSDVDNLQILFADESFSQNIGAIFDLIDSKPVLLFSQLAEDKKNVMVNYYTQENFLKFEINKANIINAGLTIKPDVILFGGTEIDVAALYKASQENLEKEKEIVSRQQRELEQLKKEIGVIKTEIEIQKQIIDRQYAEIENQGTEIKTQERTLANLSREVSSRQKVLEEKENDLAEQLETIREQEKAISQQKEEMALRLEELKHVTTEIDAQQERINEQRAILAEQTATIQIQKNLIYVFAAFILLIIAVAFLIFRNYLAQKRFNRQLAEKNNKITQQSEELQVQTENLHEANTEIKRQSLRMEQLYREVQDSIAAAKVFQQALLPPDEAIRQCFPEYFVFNQPKDIVSGDFYWFSEIGDKIIIAVADCTGHGVSGAFMSITGHHLLNDCIYAFKDDLDASSILNRLHKQVIREFHHKTDDIYSSEGMDIALCIIDKNKKRLQYAGANSPLYISRNNTIVEIKADRFPIGMFLKEKECRFGSKNVTLKEGDIIYLFSDGYADQIGGDSGMDKFLYQRFRKLLVDVSRKTMDTQRQELGETLENWRQGVEQLDDILVMGLKL